MSKNGKISNIDARSRYFKLIIFPDNDLQYGLFQRVINNDSVFDDKTKWDYIYIKHNGYDNSKEHYHLYFAFQHPMWTASLCRRFGFFRDDGEPDDQFVRVITGKFSDALIYLTHRNTPDKEQYEITDLKGSPSLINLYAKEELRYLSKKIDKRDAFEQAAKWIASQDGIISARSMVDFLVKHECFVIRHESWLRTLWYEHNSRLAYNARKEVHDAISRDAERWAEILRGIKEDAEIMPDEWFEIGGGGMF